MNDIIIVKRTKYEQYSNINTQKYLHKFFWCRQRKKTYEDDH